MEGPEGTLHLLNGMSLEWGEVWCCHQNKGESPKQKEQKSTAALRTLFLMEKKTEGTQLIWGK